MLRALALSAAVLATPASAQQLDPAQAGAFIEQLRTQRNALSDEAALARSRIVVLSEENERLKAALAKMLPLSPDQPKE